MSSNSDLIVRVGPVKNGRAFGVYVASRVFPEIERFAVEPTEALARDRIQGYRSEINKASDRKRLAMRGECDRSSPLEKAEALFAD